MKKLIILAHPSEYGFMRKSALAYAEAARQARHEVETIDLYNEPRQDYLKFNHVRDIAADPLRDKYQAMISRSDEIAFFFPLWWIDAPAILKNFIDNNLTAGFAYKYSANGKPIGLLSNKTARVFITCDGPLWLYRLFGIPFKIIWKMMILRYCGLKVSSFNIFDTMRNRSDDNKKELLAQVKTLAAQ